MPTTTDSGTCTTCQMNPKYTHSVREHEVAASWVAPLLAYVKTDAFIRSDSPLTYAAAKNRFQLDANVRRVGRVLYAVEQILLEEGWPPDAAAGITAYVVNASTGIPGYGWLEIWETDPDRARGAARAHVRELALADD
jgi:hypothetical protein